jgi:hypothetical protein
LHAKGQTDLLRHLREDFENQIVYTTHSPFMVPPDAINIVRTVNIDQDHGTTVSNNPTGDARTLFPLQAALAYHISQTLFGRHSTLVVQGVTDFWILSSVNAHLQAIGKAALPDALTITPAGGAGNVSCVAALLASQELNVIVLLDDEKVGRETQRELVTGGLVGNDAIMFVTEGLLDPKATEADVEDLIDPASYEALVNDTYRLELAGKVLTLNADIPRIVQRYEQAFERLGLQFHKTRPAREFMVRMGGDPASVLPAASAARFEGIFRGVRDRYERMGAGGRGTFGRQEREQDDDAVSAPGQPAVDDPGSMPESSIDEILNSIRLKIQQDTRGSK